MNPPASNPSGGRRRPNLIVIMTDQQRYDTIAAHGYGHVVRPNLDRLASRGVNFTHCFTAGATCVTARAALFTGMYPHNTGIYSFNDWAHHHTWVHDLRAEGYHCVNIGKMHIMPFFDDLAFHERVVVENPTTDINAAGGVDVEWGKHLSLNEKARPFDRHKTDPRWMSKLQSVPWHMQESLHSDVFVGNSALAWIRRYEGKGPVFLQIGFTGPHEPYDPLERHLAMYRGKSLPAPIYAENELATKPIQQSKHAEFNRLTDHESIIDLNGVSDDDIVEMRRHYYANVTTIDEKIGEIIRALEEKGYLENALVVFTSDHGDMLGDHRLPYKWLMYEPIVRVPLIVWDTASKRLPTVVDRFVSHLDIGPTLLQAAGRAKPAYLEGRDLFATPSGPPEAQLVFCEDNYLTMIRSRHEKYVHYTFD